MKVKIIKSFVSTIDGKIYRMGMNDVVEMPEGADWVRVGFAEPVKEEPEAATKQAPETAAKKTARKRTTRKSNK